MAVTESATAEGPHYRGRADRLSPLEPARLATEALYREGGFSQSKTLVVSVW